MANKKLKCPICNKINIVTFSSNNFGIENYNYECDCCGYLEKMDSTSTQSFFKIFEDDKLKKQTKILHKIANKYPEKIALVSISENENKDSEGYKNINDIIINAKEKTKIPPANNVGDIVKQLTKGLKLSSDKKIKIKDWLIKYQTANQITTEELEELCYKNPDWIFEKVFD